jgi:hypothetical protein
MGEFPLIKLNARHKQKNPNPNPHQSSNLARKHLSAAAIDPEHPAPPGASV